MTPTMTHDLASGHLDRLQSRPGGHDTLLKNLQKHAVWVQEGQAIATCVFLARKSRKEAAALLDVGENQLAAWVAGAERPQVERFELHPQFAAPMAVAKALQLPGVFTVEWTIRASV